MTSNNKNVIISIGAGLHISWNTFICCMFRDSHLQFQDSSHTSGQHDCPEGRLWCVRVPSEGSSALVGAHSEPRADAWNQTKVLQIINQRQTLTLTVSGFIITLLLTISSEQWPLLPCLWAPWWWGYSSLFRPNLILPMSCQWCSRWLGLFVHLCETVLELHSLCYIESELLSNSCEHVLDYSLNTLVHNYLY